MFASRLQKLSSEAQWLRLTGSLVAAIGVTVVVGWVSGVRILTTFTVAGPPSVMNTAVCLLLSATGLWAVAGGRVGLARFCGALVVAICGLVLAQFIFGCSLGIDEIFWRHEFVSALTQPGRMAMHAAAALVLVGSSLLVTATGWKRQWLLPVMGGVALAFALLPLALFLSVRLAGGESTTYRGMALPTVGSVLLLAVALIRRSDSGSKMDSWTLPFMAAALGMLLSIGVILVQNSAELNEANRRVTDTYEVRGAVDYFVSEIARMESSARGYVLTGADSFQSRDEFHRTEASGQLEKLRRLVADNPVQLARAQTLSRLTDGKFSQSSNLLRVRKEQGADAAAKYLLAQPSSISSELVNLADKIKAEENRLLEVRTRDRLAIEKGLGSMEVTGCLIALGLLGASLILARRSTTARQRAEEALISVNQLQQAVLDGTDFSVIATKPNGMIQVFNAGAEKMLGYTREEMVDRQTPAILHVGKEVVARAAQLTSDFGRRIDPGFEVLIALAQMGSTEEREWTYVRKDGSRLAVLLSVTALRNNQGGITGFLGIARDLTAQKASEAAREEINERIVKLGEQVPGMIYQFRLKPDGASSLPYASEGIRQIYGLTPEAVRVDASRIFATIHPDDRERLSESIQTSARSLLPWFLEYRVRRIDGAERWLEGHARPERERDGSILWHGFVSDVTERKQLEDAVVRESTLLRTAIDLLPQSVYLKDTENRFLMANQALAKRVGKDSGAQLVGLRDSDLFGERDAEKTRADEAAVLGGKAIFEQEETLFYQDKQSRTVLTTKVPFRAADGKIIGILGTGFDITEHKKAGIERALSEERLRLATEAAGVAVWDWDLVSGFVSWDRRMFEIHAIEPTATKEIGYQIWMDAVHPEDVSDQATQLKALAETGGRGQREFRILRGPERAIRFIQAAEMVIKDDRGRPVRMVGINIDITERKQAEAVLQVTRTRLEKTFASMSEGLVLQDSQGGILECNLAAQRILGLSRDQIAGRTSFDPQWRCVYEDGTAFLGADHPSMVTLRTGEAQRDVVMGVYKSDGSLAWLEINTELIGKHDSRERQVVSSFRDVTARRASEQAVRVSEEFNRRIVENSDDCLKILSLDARILDMAAPGRRLMCVSNFDDIRNADWRTFWQGKDRVSAEHALQQALEGRSGRFQGFCPTMNGTPKWWDVMISPLNGPDGKPEQLLSISRDITESKNAEAAIQASEEQFRSISRAAPVGIYQTDPQGYCVYVNHRWTEIAGLSEEAAMGAGWSATLFPADRAMIEAAWIAFVGEGREFALEYRFEHRSGDVIWVAGSAVALRDAEGKLTGYLGTVTDITRAKEAEQATFRALTELEQQRFALDQHALVAVTDVKGRIIHANNKFCAVSQYKREELLGKNHRMINSGHHPKAFFEEMYQCIEVGKVWHAEICNRAKDGSLYWVDTTIVPFMGPNEKPTHYIAIRTDITERKQLGVSLAQARDQALQGSRLKSEFLANMSHEIRTPMNGIIGMTGLLMDSPLEENQREMGRVINASAENLLEIINDILDFSKIEAGKMRIEPEEFELRPVFEDTLALMSGRAHEKGLELLCDLDDRLGIMLLGDAGRLRQMLTNLTGNAIKFTAKGEVLVRAKLVAEKSDHVRIRVSVHDTGIGIPPEIQARLFQAFSQADGSTTRIYGGTGLGLAITRQLVELMGGKIGLQSEVGKGSEFWFELDLPRGSSGLLARPRPLPAGIRVLVVDDNVTNLKILVRQITALGARVDAVSSGSAALAQLQAAAQAGAPYAVAVLDWHMPEMDGLQLGALIRRDAAFAGTQLLMLSSAGPLVKPNDTARANFAAFLDKPVRAGQLHHTLSQVLGQAAVVIRTPTQPSGLDWHGDLNLLVADDNPTNQLVIQRLLEKLGCRVNFANNGAEAVRMVGLKRYDAVLMDCQMPVMDGYSATQQIRLSEAAGRMRRIPIIALTAYAMSSDRAKCLDAGMDEYLSKPLRMEELKRILQMCIPTARVAAGEPLVPAVPLAEQSVLEAEQVAVLRELPGRKHGTLLQDLVELFMGEVPSMQAKLSVAMASRQKAEISALSHRLAGSCANLGAFELRAAALSVERSCGQDDWPAIAASLVTLDREWQRVKPAFERIQAESSTP